MGLWCCAKKAACELDGIDLDLQMQHAGVCCCLGESNGICS